MNERRDDTTKPEAEKPGAAAERDAPGRYYYDDATGYEPYRPEDDDEEGGPEDGPRALEG